MKRLLVCWALALVVLPALAGEVTGRVWVSDSGAASGAGVRFTPADGSEPIVVITDKNGDYRKDLPPGQYRVQVSHQGASSNQVGLRVSDGTRADLEIRKLPDGGWLLTKR